MDALSDGKFINETQPTVHGYKADGTPITYKDFVNAFNEANIQNESTNALNSTSKYDRDSLSEQDIDKAASTASTVKNMTITIFVRLDYVGPFIIGIGQDGATPPTKYELENGLDGDGYRLYRLDFFDTVPESHTVTYLLPDHIQYEIFIYLKGCSMRGAVEKPKFTIN